MPTGIDRRAGVRPGPRQIASSGVSQALVRIAEEGPGDGLSRGDGNTPAAGSLIRLQVANSLALREKAFRLAYSVYRAQGYIGEEPRQWLVKSFDLREDTLVLLAEDALSGGNAEGTVTLYFDQAGGVPADVCFPREMEALRRAGRKMAEVSRLVLTGPPGQGREVLVLLFNAIFAYARRIMACTDFLIQVHPRHQAFYQRKLGFELVSGARPCPQVRNSPAVLLRLDLAIPERRVAQLGGEGGVADQGEDRTLYSHFFAPAAEALLLARIRREVRPISPAECAHFSPRERCAETGCL